jgi:hypothetical protein
MPGQVNLMLRKELKSERVSADAINEVLAAIVARLEPGSVTVDYLAEYLAMQASSLTNIAALKAVAITQIVGEVANYWLVVRGGTTAYDGNGGIFVWDAASTATGDDINVVVSNDTATGRWRRLTPAISALADDSVTTAKLADGAVINTKIATGAIETGHLAERVVTSAKLASEAVGLPHLHPEVLDSVGTTYDSDWQDISFTSNAAEWAHGLGDYPQEVEVWIKVASGVGPLSAGEAVRVETFLGEILPAYVISGTTYSWSVAPFFTVAVNSTHVKVRSLAALTTAYIPHHGSSLYLAAADLTNAEIRVVARIFG